MANLVKAYKGRRHSRQPVFKSITYVERGDTLNGRMVNETTDDFEYNGQRLNDYDSLQASIAKDVARQFEADMLPDEEIPSPDHL